MSTRLVPVLVCDGCGAEIDMDFYIRVNPGSDRRILQKDTSEATERDFCCEACREWWKAQYPESGPWGPAWDERDWWRQSMLTCDHVPVRTTRDSLPLVDTHSHFENPEPIRQAVPGK